MINKFSFTKNILIALVFIIGLLYFLPNIYGEDYAVQLSATKGNQVNIATLKKVEKIADVFGSIGSSLADEKILIRFKTQENQRNALNQIKAQMGDGYIVALNLAPKTPAWLQSLGGDPMNLGLDLRGGVHFLMEIDLRDVMSKKTNSYINDIRTILRKAKVRFSRISKLSNYDIVIRFDNEAKRDKAQNIIGDAYRELAINTKEEDGTYQLMLAMNESVRKEASSFALQQNITTLRNRVNELGVSEPIIQQQGENRIVVQLPGIQDTTRAKEILGATATLDFRLVDETNDPYTAVESGKIPPLSILRKDRDGNPILLKRRVIVTGESIVDASSGLDSQSGLPAVFVNLDGRGARRLSIVTRDNIGKRMAVVFIENKISSKMVNGKRKRSTERVEEVINVATIQDHLSNRFQITGLDNVTEAQNLALYLRAGSLAAPMEIVEERTVGPTLGQDNIDRGLMSVVVGMILVLLFMAIYYKVFGLIANVALVVNVVMVVSLLSIIQAVLTLPGIAGIVLTVGMAVDANVLIFERIREELHAGNSAQAAIHSGYDKAYTTIMDANVTTLIAAVVLFAVGTGTIKGFAITLALGIVTSMFTSIVGTRALVNLIYGGKSIKKIFI